MAAHAALASIVHALGMAGAMAWQIAWPLILGFFLSAAIQAVVSKREMSALLPDDSPRSLALACGLGAASSSCSYAAVALARAVFAKGANFTAAMAFEIASTNLVLELGIILWVLMGWPFMLAEFVGGLVMVAVMALLHHLFLSPELESEAAKEAAEGRVGKMEGHAAMDMAVTEGSLWRRLGSPRAYTAISHYFVMDWSMVWVDIALGLLIAGAIEAWVPSRFWAAFFLTRHPRWAMLWGPLVGPLVAILSFVCSVGNVPLAAVLWSQGISFGGVLAFLFADLLVLPILNIYRRYYGLKMSAFVFATFYFAMAVAALLVDLAFAALGLVPAVRAAEVAESALRWNYTTILNLLFGLLAGALLVRFFRTGGMQMMRAMRTSSS